MTGQRAKIEIRDLSKTFSSRKSSLTVIGSMTLEVPENQFLSIVGTSGCGKSTLLNVVGGLEEPSDGVVLVDGRSIEGPGRDRGFVFQSYSLFEWMTVERNIRSEEHTSELQSLMRISYAVFCLKK